MSTPLQTASSRITRSISPGNFWRRGLLVLALLLLLPAAGPASAGMEPRRTSAVLRPDEPVDKDGLNPLAQISGPGADLSPKAIPPDPLANFPWILANSGSNWWMATTLAQVEAAFNAARTHENGDSVSAGYEPMPLMNLAGSFSQAAWDALTPSQQALWLLNSERAARGLPQFEGLNADLAGVTQGWVQILLDTDQWTHGDLVARINANISLNNCWQLLGENLAAQYSTSSTFRFSVPVAKAIYDWTYDDAGSTWGHRHNNFYDPFVDNTGITGQEALVGFGVAEGANWTPPGINAAYAYIEGLDFYDPQSTCGSLVPAGGSPVHADYGDLPASYGLAWHTSGGPYLGATKSLESTTPSAETNDDGVTPASLPWVAGGSETVNVTIGSCTGPCYLSAWVDWNGDGQFGAGEAILTNQVVSNGANPGISFSIPAAATCLGSTCQARFRLFGASQLAASAAADRAPAAPSPSGGATGGEVEDFTWTSGVLAVTLADFFAVQQGDAVLLTWETNSELNNRGFNLYRGTSAAGPDRQLNETLIPSQSQGNPGGFVYTWEDRANLVPGTTYFYWVEDVDIYGVATMHGPVSVDYTVPTAVTLSGVQASPAAGTAIPLAGTLLALLAPLVGALGIRRRRRA